jgi:hypothetical protein
MLSRIAVALALMVALAGCTAQERAKSYGGTATTDLEPCRKLVVATWKDNHLWLLTKPMAPGDKPETYQFKESSSFGLMQGTVIISEHACK